MVVVVDLLAVVVVVLVVVVVELYHCLGIDAGRMGSRLGGSLLSTVEGSTWRMVSQNMGAPLECKKGNYSTLACLPQRQV